MNRKHYHDLDGIRGLLSILVMLYHYGLDTAVSRLTTGRLAAGQWEFCVDFFFMLSGFVLCRSCVLSRPSASSFFIRRLLRLAPMFAVGTLAAVTTGRVELDTMQVVSNLLMVQSLVGLPSIDHPAWSISFEFYLPLLAVALLSLTPGKRAPPRMFIATVLVLAIAHGLVLFLFVTVGEFFLRDLTRAAMGLALGASVHVLRTTRVPPASAVLELSTVGAFLTIMLCARNLPIVALLVPFACIGALWWGAEARTFFSTKPFQMLGRWSYSIYLLHIPVLLGAESAFGADALHGATSKIALIACVIALSAATYRLIEKPLLARAIVVAHGSDLARAPPVRP